MDPNLTLEVMMARVSRILEANDNEQPVKQEDAVELAESVEALNGWIAKGGFLPTAWKGASNG